MPTLNLKDVTKYVEQNIGTFHAKRLEKLEKLNFKEVLKRKNPYLFIEPLGHQAKEKNEEFLKAYSKVVNQFTLKFAQDFCDDGVINWQKIVEFNSQKKPKVAKITNPKAKKPSAKKQ